MKFLDYDHFLNEAYYKNHNLHKVMASAKPVIGPPVFQAEEAQSVYAVRRKIQDNLINYEKHVAERTAKDRELRAAAAGQKGEKGMLDLYNVGAKSRDLAFKIVKDSAAFMVKFNNLYDSLKEDLTGTDHVKVAKAIYELLQIYPHELINEAGRLKRLRSLKLDAQFISDVLKWTNSISKIYETLDEAGKVLGKSEKQIEAARKQSIAQRMRWGM